MEPVICDYCKKDLKDPEIVVIGTFRFTGPRTYHIDCYEKMKLDSTWKKLPRSIWTNDKLFWPIILAVGRVVAFILFILILIASSFVSLMSNDAESWISVSIYTVFILFFSLATVVNAIKSVGYIKIWDHLEKLDKLKKNEEIRKVDGSNL